jgi:hypothetical protein
MTVTSQSAPYGEPAGRSPGTTGVFAPAEIDERDRKVWESGT